HTSITLFPYTTLFRSLREFISRTTSAITARTTITRVTINPEFIFPPLLIFGRKFHDCRGSHVIRLTSVGHTSARAKRSWPRSRRSEEHTSELQSLRHL